MFFTDAVDAISLRQQDKIDARRPSLSLVLKLAIAVFPSSTRVDKTDRMSVLRFHEVQIHRPSAPRLPARSRAAAVTVSFANKQHTIHPLGVAARNRRIGRNADK